MIVMKRCYCSPSAESICVETFVLAASTNAASRVAEKEFADENVSGSWGNIWE
jgi:hypothetical protein